LIRLIFQSSSSHPSTIEFELSADDAMNLMDALQTVQRQTRWRAPQFFGSGRGKRPIFRIVKDEDE